MGEQFNFQTEAEDLLIRAVEAFAAWMAENWTITAGEVETLTNPSQAPEEYARGYNAGLASISDAIEIWLENGAMINA